jgi:hypothetical protein
VTFLWIVAWPLYSCIKRGGEKASLTAHYRCRDANFFAPICVRLTLSLIFAACCALGPSFLAKTAGKSAALFA